MQLKRGAAGPAAVAGLGLEAMPCEILRLICACFSLSPYQTGDTFLPDRFADNRSTLRQLCLTSRRLQRAAVPFLYEVVIIHGPGQRLPKLDLKLPPLLLLLRSLLAAPHVRPALRHIACLVNLKGSRVSRRELEAIRNLWNSHCLGIAVPSLVDARILQLAGLPTRATPDPTATAAAAAANADATTETGPIPEDSSLQGLPERIFAAILCLASNLDSVVFQMPRCSVIPSNIETIRCAVTSNIIDTALQDEVVGSSVLQNLTAVTVQPDMGSFLYFGWDDEHQDDEDEDDDDDEEDQEICRGVRLDACPGLFRAPNVTVVEGFKESGGWDALPRQTRDIRIGGILKPTTLSTICDYPNLERLTVRPAAMDMIKAEADDDEFNNALLKRASTLKYLDFQTMGNETLTSNYGPQRRLHCLPRLTELEELKIELFALFGTSEEMGGGGAPLADLIPHSLRALTVLEQWTYGDAACLSGDEGEAEGGPQVAAYRRRLLEMLAVFAKDCATRTPRLARFGFVGNAPASTPVDDDGPITKAKGRDGPEDQGPSPVEFERLKALFAEAGVKMELEMLACP
ncbi:hypothetical protein RB594_007372 [Gaeumannomyces avenae]